MEKILKHKRRKARRLVLQGLYQIIMTDENSAIVVAELAGSQNPKKVDLPYFQETLTRIAALQASLHDTLKPFVDRPLEEVGPIEFSLLQMGAYELVYCLEIPYRVVINENLELAKIFGAEESYKFVNSVLDPLAREVRRVEVECSSARSKISTDDHSNNNC